MVKTISRALWIGMALAAFAALLPLAAAAQSMSREPGTNRRGSDYDSFRVVQIDDCERACLGDRRCRAYTFNANEGLCYLKDRVPDAVEAPGRTSGVKRDVDDRPGPGSGDLTEERGIDYHGADYASDRVRDLGECQYRCRRDRRCVSYSYDVRAAVCYLKDRVGDRRRDSDKIGGVKEGYAPDRPRPSYPGGGDLWEQRGYDYHGGDYTSSRVRGLGECQDLCWNDRRCLAYSYDVRAAICYLKDRVYDRRSDDSKVTGLKRR